MPNDILNGGVLVDDITFYGESKPQSPKVDFVEMNQSETILTQILNILQGFKVNSDDTKNVDGCKTNWMLVAMVIDRFLLIVFFSLTVFVALGILLNKPSYNNEEALMVE